MEEIKQVDVAIIGGAFSGATAGLLIKRALPSASILLVEKSSDFDRKVGESTSELAGCFLTRKLGLAGYLSREHITKHGLRMWFNSPGNDCMGKCSEMGAKFQVRLPTYQLDRSRLDAHLLDLAEEAGCELWRPAALKSVELGGEGHNLLEVEVYGRRQRVQAKWVIDASGKASYLARKNGHLEKLEDHPINAIWARFRNVKDLDSYELGARYPEYGNACLTPRGSATNHLMGRGWWCWIIPLNDGDVSAGLVYDPRIFQPEEAANLTEKLHRHLLSHPVGREMFDEAVPVEKDTRAYSHLPYRSTQVAGDGWATVGDAAGFIDPLYSQGLDYCAHTVCAVQKIVCRALKGECVADSLRNYNDEYQISYERWYRALYQGKYRYLGDAEVMWAAFMLDVATYFIGPVRLVYEHTEEEFGVLPYGGRVGKMFGDFMAFYNRRLAKLADKRFAAGVSSRQNTGRRFLVKKGFVPTLAVATLLFHGVMAWWKCEITSLFLRPGRSKPMMGIPATTEEAASGRAMAEQVKASSM